MPFIGHGGQRLKSYITAPPILRNFENETLYNLALEGKMETHRKEYATKGERAQIRKHQDNLKVEAGASFATKTSAQAALRGDRAKVVKHKDALGTRDCP